MSTVKKTAKVEPKAVDKAAVVAETPKAAAEKKAPVKAEAPKAATEKKAPVKAEAPKTAADKKAPAKKAAKATEKKAAAEKKAPAKRAAKATEEVFIEYAGTQVSTSDIVNRVVEATGKKASAIKALNIYVQPETGKIYYTADGATGEIAY